MLDIIKIICALMILFYHYFSEIGHVGGIFEDLLSGYAVAVALFMTISGFLTFFKIQSFESYNEKRACLFKQVLRILKIYLLWSVIYLIYSVSTWDFNDISLLFVLDKIRQWIFQSTFYTIWFMPALAVGLIITFYLIKWLGYKGTAILAVVAYAFGSLLSTYSFFTRDVSFFVETERFCTMFLQGPRGGIFYAFPLTFLGACLAAYKNNISVDSKIWVLFLIAVVSVCFLLVEAILLRHYVGNTGIDLTVTMPFVCCCVVLFACSVNVGSNGFLVFCRKLSVLIFMSQRIFLTIIPNLISAELYDTLFHNQLLGCVFVCGGTILFSSLIVLLSKKIVFLKHLY